MIAETAVTGGHARYFYQPSGAGPLNEMYYGGLGAAHMYVTGSENPVRSDIEPINVRDPLRTKEYKAVGSMSSPTNLPKATAHFMQRHGGIPRHLYDLGRDKPVTFFMPVGKCKDLSDFANGWETYITVWADGLVTSPSVSGHGSFDGDDPFKDELPFTFRDIYRIGSMQFTEQPGEAQTRLVDVVFAPSQICRDNNRHIYGVSRGDTGIVPVLKYSHDGGRSFSEIAIDVAGDERATFIAVVGRNVLVGFEGAADSGYWWTSIDPVTSVPTMYWVPVVIGTSAINDIYVASPFEAWLVASDGSIYLSANIKSGAFVFTRFESPLRRIAGRDTLVVAVGDGGLVAVAQDRVFTGSIVPGAANLTAVEVLESGIWVGDDAGNIFYSSNKGYTWTQVAQEISGVVESIRDIRFVNNECGYITGITADGVSILAATMNGGERWTASEPRLRNMPVATIERLAFPNDANETIAVNNLAICGSVPDGAGALFVAQPGVVG